MKIIERTVQEVSLDTEDLEKHRIYFLFKCCGDTKRLSLEDLVGGENLCWHCSNRACPEVVGLDIKQS